MVFSAEKHILPLEKKITILNLDDASDVGKTFYGLWEKIRLQQILCSLTVFFIGNVKDICNLNHNK